MARHTIMQTSYKITWSLVSWVAPLSIVSAVWIRKHAWHVISTVVSNWSASEGHGRSHKHWKSGNILETVQDIHIVTTDHWHGVTYRLLCSGRLIPRLHDTTGLYNPVWQPCWTNSRCSFNRLSNRVVQPVWQLALCMIQPVVKRVWQPVNVWQQVVLCKRGLRFQLI